MQITFTTMKYRDKNYISLGTCFVLMLPIIVFTALLTYCLSGTFHTKPRDVEQTSRPGFKDDDEFKQAMRLYSILPAIRYWC
jgi:hypothetical protein